MNDKTLEQRIADRPAAKVTPADLDAAVQEALYISPASVVGEWDAREPTTGEKCLTICVVTMTNGFTVVGTSACAHPDNYDQDIGEELALKDAKRQMWPLLGYALRDRLYREPTQ